MSNFLILLCFLFLQSAMAQVSYRPGLPGEMQFPWPSDQPPAPDVRSVTKPQIESFLNSLFRHDGGTRSVGEFGFVPLRPGRLSLVAVLGHDGWFDDIAVVDPTENVFNMTILSSYSPHDLGKEVVDLDADGLYEIVAKWPAGGYQGSRTRSIFVYRIYKTKDASLLDASSQFPDYFQKVVIPEVQPALQRVKERLEAGLAYEDPRDPEQAKRLRQDAKDDLVAATAEAQFVLDHYQRAVYGRKNAGLETALAWSQSADSGVRVLGAKALAEMDHPLALAALARLEKDGSPVVSNSAKWALQQVKLRAPQGSATR